MQEPSQLDVRNLLWIARRYRWLIGLVVIALFCGSFLYVKYVPPLYESTTLLSVGNRAQVSSALEGLVRAGSSMEGARERVRRVNDRIHSRNFLVGIVQEMELDRRPGLLAQAREAARQWPELTAEEHLFRVTTAYLAKRIAAYYAGEDLIRISAKSGDPSFALRLSSSVANAIILESKESSLGRARARGEFSADQGAVYQERLRTAEQALRQFQESQLRKNLTNSPVQRGNYDDARAMLQGTVEESGQIVARLDDTRKHWTSLVGDQAPPPTLRSPVAEGLESRLVNLESILLRSLLRAEEGAADLRALQEQVASVRQTLYAEYSTLAMALTEPYSTEARLTLAGIATDRAVLRSIREKRRLLEGYISAFETSVRDQPRADMELNRLRADVETYRTLVQTFEREGTSSKLLQALEASALGFQLQIAESADLPLNPIWPNRRKIFAVAILLGPLLSTGLVFAIERLGMVVQTVEQVEREIGVPVIGTVPKIEGWKAPGTYFQRHWAPISIAAILILTGVLYSVHGLMNPSPSGARPQSTTEPGR